MTAGRQCFLGRCCPSTLESVQAPSTVVSSVINPRLCPWTRLCAFATDRPSFVCPSRTRRGPGASHGASPSFQPPCPVPSPHPTRFPLYLNL